MNKIRLIFGIFLLGLAGCLEKSNTTPGTSSTILYRHHFLGTASLAHNTNFARIPAILALPATREFSDEILDKISKTPEQLWRKFLPPGASTPPGLARPLLDDLATAESFAEVHGPLHRSESVFAIELNDARAGIWRTNLGHLVTAWNLGKPSPLSLGQETGWELKKADAQLLIQFVRAGKWALVGVGQERLTLLPGLLETIRKTGRPVASEPNVPLTFEADLPRLGDWLPGLAQSRLPPVHLTLTGKGDYLRTEARLTFSDPLPWKSEPWKIPTNFVRDPIVSFTAARGIAPLLGQVKGISALGLNPLPNQFCAWGPASIHTETLLSIPMPNASNVLYQIGPKMPDFTKGLFSQPMGGFSLVTNRGELLWQGWPILLPQVRAIRDAGAEYLLGRLLPMAPRNTNSPPAEMFSQLNRTNLVYYDWEFTAERLVHGKQMQQLWDMANFLRFPSTNAPGQKWLVAIAPHLGNTITEVSLESPRELSGVRKSDLGLTGIEAATLVRWVASPGFPWTFEAPRPTSAHPNRATPPPLHSPDPKTTAPGPKK